MKIFAYCGLALAVFLGGCSYFDTGEAKPETAAKTAAVDLTAKQVMTAQPVTDDQKISNLIATKTDGSVEYFPLDSSAPSVTSPTTPVVQNPLPDASADSPISDGLPPRRNMKDDAIPVAPIPTPDAAKRSSGPVVMPTNPSVTVYPLDDAMRSALPPQQSYNAFQPSDAGNSVGDKVAVIYFGHGSVSLDSGDFETVRTIANRIAGGNITVTGFASTDSTIDDPVRRKISNLKISMDRALSVVKALTGSGIEPNRITTVAYGEARPAGDAAQSRRVEISGL